MSQCSYRLWALPEGAIDNDRPLVEQLIPVICKELATETITYTHPKLIRVHGETQELCADHLRDQQMTVRFTEYLEPVDG